MKRMWYAAFVLSLVLLSSPNLCMANGTSYNFVTIIGVDVRSDGTFLLDITAPMRSSPTCAKVINRVTGDSNTTGGKILLETALSAFLSGKQVFLEGTGLCSQYSNIESLYRLYVH
jgi:hypothetical protein